MRTFITYMLSALFLLFFAETKVFASAQHSQGNLTSQAVINDNTHFYHAGKVVETKFSRNSTTSQTQELISSVEQTEDDLLISNRIDLDTCFKLLGAFLILNFSLKSLRKNRIFYNKTIKISSCKYILLRTIRI